MTTQFRSAALFFQMLMQRVACLLFICLGVGLAGYTALAAMGVVPWLAMPLQFGETLVADGGTWLQVGVTLLAFGLIFFLPTNARVMALETSHRKFHMNMRDVARAYSASHKADREGVFTLPSEFDSVRERIAWLRDHPDLGDLEPSVLEVAAQMSHVSRDLAQTYSDRNVARARDFLTARQTEIDELNDRLVEAKQIANEIRQWNNRVELEEDVAEAQMVRLCEELEEILPEILPETAHREAPLVLAQTDRTSERVSGWTSGPAEAHPAAPRPDDRVVPLGTRQAAE